MRGSALLLVCPACAFCPPAALHASRHVGCRPALLARRYDGLHGAERARSTVPLAVASSPEEDAPKVEPDPSEPQLELGAVGRYAISILMQMILITFVFGAIDLASYSQLGGPLPWQAVVGIFLLLSVRSRIFSPLDNSRPNTAELRNALVETDASLEALLAGQTTKNQLKEECVSRGLSTEGGKEEMVRQLNLYLQRPALAGERVMPSWTPPGVTFPIMWLGVVAPLRAFSSSVLYETSTGRLNEAHLNDPVLLWLALHLCVGDVWNTSAPSPFRSNRPRARAVPGPGASGGKLATSSVVRRPAHRRRCGRAAGATTSSSGRAPRCRASSLCWAPRSSPPSSTTTSRRSRGGCSG
jgi:hypothetical protein